MASESLSVFDPIAIALITTFTAFWVGYYLAIFIDIYRRRK